MTTDLTEVSSLPRLSAAGFDGGRDSFRRFCGRAFEPDHPRFLQTDDGALVVYRHADLRALGAMPEFGNVPPAVLFPQVYGRSSGEPADGADRPYSVIASVISNQVFTANPPIHGPIRLALLEQVGPKAIARLGAVATAATTSLLDDLPQSRPFDFVEGVAEQLTARFWGALLGLTDAEIDAIAKAIRAATPMLFIERSLDQVRQVDQALAAYAEIIERASQRSLGSGRCPMVDDLSAALAKVHQPDDPDFAGLVPKSVGALLAGNLFDGFHTAAVAVANAVFVLMQRPEVLAQVRAKPDLLGTAVAEALRLEPPVLMLRRLVITDMNYSGLRLGAGTQVAMFWAAGNHDPAAFPDPGRFDLSRSHQGLTTFGGGGHICPGRFVAAMLAKSWLGGMIERGWAFEFEEASGAWLDNHLMSQLSRLNVRLKAL